MMGNGEEAPEGAMPPPTEAPTETRFSDDPIEHTAISATFMTVIIVMWLIFGHKIQGMFRWTRWISEGSMACLLGLISGVTLLAWDTVHDSASTWLSFDSATFFTYMLPPIIFYGGLAMRRKLFVSNLLSIVAFGILGTFISFGLLGFVLYSLSLLPNVLSASDCFSLAAIFAATDSVAVLQVLRPESHPALYSIVLGEGVLNDATSVALLRTVAKTLGDADLSFGTALAMLSFFAYVFAASFALGLAAGLLIAMVMKHLAPFSQPQEVSLVGALAFLSYLLAELVGLSGILALFFCGMAVSNYALQHISKASRHALLNFFRTLSYLLEGLIFLYVGRDALDPGKWAAASFFQALYLLVTIIALVALSRAAFVFPLAWLHNRWSNQPLTVNDSIVVWWAGMMRGAVSVAMVYYRFDPRNTVDDQHAATIVVSTLQVVLFSTVILGGLTGPLLKILLPQKVGFPDVTGAQLHGPERSQSPSNSASGRSPSYSMTVRLLPGRGAASVTSSEYDADPEAARGLLGSGHLDGKGLYGARPQQRVAMGSARDLDAVAATAIEMKGVVTGQSPDPPGPTFSLPSASRLAAHATTGGRTPSRPQRPPSAGLSPVAAATASASAVLTEPRKGSGRHSPGQDTQGVPQAALRSDAGGEGVQGTASCSRTPMMRRSSRSLGDLRRPADGWAGPGQGVGDKMLNAAKSLAVFTGFDGTGVPASADGALGDVMYERFKTFDSKYMQPLFGKGERQMSEDVGLAGPGASDPFADGSAPKEWPPGDS